MRTAEAVVAEAEIAAICPELIVGSVEQNAAGQLSCTVQCPACKAEMETPVFRLKLPELPIVTMRAECFKCQTEFIVPILQPRES